MTRRREEVTLAPLSIVVEHKNEMCNGTVVIKHYIDDRGHLIVIPRCGVCGVNTIVDTKSPVA